MKKNTAFKVLSCLLCLLLGALTLSACAGGESKTEETTTVVPTGEHTRVKFEMKIGDEDIGSFTMELYPEYAPITVENFFNLVNDGFYDGLTFHRVIEGFMAQGGDPEGTGSGQSDPIKGEFSANGVDNRLSHTRGVVSMARRGNDNDSGSCQFFICYSDDYTSVLDGQYAAFGKVIEGMEVVDSFCDVELTYGSDNAISSPTTPIVISSARVVS